MIYRHLITNVWILLYLQSSSVELSKFFSRRSMLVGGVVCSFIQMVLGEAGFER